MHPHVNGDAADSVLFPAANNALAPLSELHVIVAALVWFFTLYVAALLAAGLILFAESTPNALRSITLPRQCKSTKK